MFYPISVLLNGNIDEQVLQESNGARPSTKDATNSHSGQQNDSQNEKREHSARNGELERLKGASDGGIGSLSRIHVRNNDFYTAVQ